jgi:two-component system sensor histidine kinase KdpD
MSTRDVVAFVGSLIALAVVTAALHAMPHGSPTTVALALLLIVLGTATVTRLWIAIVASIAATLTFNFFFLPPSGTLAIDNPQNWIALVVFLAVAVIASNLSAAAQEKARGAIARRNEVTRLFDLTRDVLRTTDTATAIDALARHVARRFDLSHIAICLPSNGGWRISEGGAEALPIEIGALNDALKDERPRADAPSGVTLVPLRHGAKPVGLLAVSSTALTTGTLEAIAGVVAIAIERAQFLAERDAAELVRQKADLASALLASLSHDLRTPLTAIRVAVENMSGSDLSDSDRHLQARAAIVELDRLTRLFQDILDMARIDADAILIDRQWVTASDVVDAAMALVRHTLSGRAVRVDADSDIETQVDPRLASAALSHLLENAAQYSPADQPINVVARVEADGLHVVVVDHGRGLDPGEMNQLFDRFYRGRAAPQASGGTGMGLSITRGLLTAAGGRVWAGNAPGAGAQFSMVVPGPTRPVPVGMGSDPFP